MQEEDGEQTSSGEPTMSGEPTTTQADEGAEDASETVRAGDAEATTGSGGSVVVRAGDAEVTTGAGGAVARAGDVVAAPGVAEGNGGADASGSTDAGNNEAELRLAGDAGTSFSGACVVGGEPTMLEGEVPARLDYELDDGGLACEIGKTGSGLLRVVLSVGESQVVRETNAEDAKIELVYRGGEIIASTSSSSQSSTSVSSSNSVVQQSSNVQSQSSDSSSRQSSSSSINQSVSATN